MPDRYDEDDFWDEPREAPRPRSGPEGVRIIGSEEAEDAVESGRAARRLGEDDLHFGDVPPRPDPPAEPTATFPLPDDRDLNFGFEDPPTWSASAEGTGGETPSYDEPVPLPDWDAPRRAVSDTDFGDAEFPDPGFGDQSTGDQTYGGGQSYEDDDVDAWSSISGRSPRVEPEPTAWADDQPEWQAEPEAPVSTGYDDQQVYAEDVVEEEHPDVVAPDDVVPGFYDDTRTGRRTRGRGRGRGRGTGPIPPPRDPREPRDAGGLEGEEPPDHEPPAGVPADLMTRVLTAAAVAVVALVMFKIGDAAATLFVAVVVGAAAFEIYEGFRLAGYHPATVLGLLGSFGGVLIAYNEGLDAFPLVVALMVVFTMIWYMAEVVPRARPIVNIALTLFGFLWIGGFGMFAGMLLSAPNGTGLVMGLAICAVGYDVVGYFVGQQFGRSKLAPRLSPNKTWEGLLGGMAASVVLGIIVSSVIGLHPWDEKVGYGFALGLVVAVMAPLGDLVESMVKRDLGVKDLGTVLPGHGGVLDRFDGILFCLPAVYYLAVQLNIG